MIDCHGEYMKIEDANDVDNINKWTLCKQIYTKIK